MNPLKKNLVDWKTASLAFVGACAGLQGAGTGSQGAAQKPDIFVIFTDEWSPRDTSWNNPMIKTPHLDAIAQEGMRFNSAYTPSPVCMAARTCLLTGQYPHNTGLWGNSTDYAPMRRQATLFADLKAAGYTTAQIGKLHWTGGSRWQKEFGAESLEAFYRSLSIDHPEDIPSPNAGINDRGAFREFANRSGQLEAYSKDIAWRLKNEPFMPKASALSAAEHNEAFVTQRALDFLEAQPADKPLFLVVSWFGPHPPLDAPEPYASMYDPEKIAPPPNVKFPYLYFNKQITKDYWQRAKANYFGKMTYIDDQVARVVAALKKRGNWDNTLVIFVSDHGEMLGAHGFMGKVHMHEESAGIPMFVRPPKGVKVAAKETNVPVSLLDVYATAVEAAGGTMTTQRVSRSLLPIVTGQDKGEKQRPVFSEIYYKKQLSTMARKGDWKWFVEGGQTHLYNLKDDPYELNNLAGKVAHADKVVELREDYHNFLLRTQINYAEGYKGLSDRMRERDAKKKAQ